MDAKATGFLEPTPVEKFFNRVMGMMVGAGIGPAYMYVLQVRGRKSGKLFSTPVNVMDVNGKRYLVAPRGRTQWVRNVEAAGSVDLKRGSTRQTCRLREIPESERPELLKMYLVRYAGAVQRYFSVKAGSPVEAFRTVAGQYPVFELVGN